MIHPWDWLFFGVIGLMIILICTSVAAAFVAVAWWIVRQTFWPK